MRRRIERAAHRVARFGDDLVAEGDDRANRHFAGRRGLGGKVERAAHRRRERKAHRARLAKAAPTVSYMALLVTGAA